MKYQMLYYRRFAGNVWRGICAPTWFTGRAARFCYLGALAIMLVINICEITSATSGGYEMRDLQKKVELLRDDIQNLNVQVASENALPAIQKRIENSGLARVENITYLVAADSIVARK